MLKKIWSVVLLACVLPVSANAASWSLNTWVKSGGGSLAVRGGAAQTSTQGSFFKSYTTAGSIPVVVSANPGYVIGKLTVNGNLVVPPSLPYTATVAGPDAQSVTATFRAIACSVTATAGTGGTVSPASIAGVLYGQILQKPIKFVVTPNPGFNVAGLTGIPVGAKANGSVPAPVNKSVVVTLPRGFVFTGPLNLAASFSGLGADAGPTQTVPVGRLVTLDGSASTGGVTSWLWSQTSGPGFPASKVISDNSPGARVSFTAAAEGVYGFRLTINGGATSFTSVTVSSSSATAVRTLCQNCHQNSDVGMQSNVFGAWSSSKHKSNYVVCSECHVGVDTGAHPGPAITSPILLNACNRCHVSSGTVANHPIAIGSSLCVACHDPHSTKATVTNLPGAHFNNSTSAGYPASYVTSRSTCGDCHTGTQANSDIRQQWKTSGHGATSDTPWTAYDFKTRSECVRCHTTTGFIAYSSAKVTAAWGVASDKTKEVLTCAGCHSDVAAGTVRTVVPNRPFADEAGYQNHDVGTSNICMDCHSGRNNGTSISKHVAFGAFTTSAFIAPHYLTAGGSLQGKSGYHFPGRSYADYSSNAHRKAGLADSNATGTDGPCVTCHMSATAKHLFTPVASDASGAITSITTGVCANCHGSALPAATLEAKRLEYSNALSILNAQLTASGHPYSADYPYFGAGNWGTGQNGANVMGAAFNYKVLAAEPGAYAHNPEYAKQLIIDSIDAAYHNGVLTGDISAALAALKASGAISQAQVDSLNGYQSPTSACNGCHGYPPTSVAGGGPHTTATDCTTCHVYTTAGADTHNNGVVNMKNLVCGSCHGTETSTPALATGSHPQHFAAIASTDPLVVCAKCHIYTGQVFPHANGTVDMKNGGCAVASCHGSIAAPTWGVNNMGDDCTKCHGTATTNVTVANRNVVAPSDATAAGTGKVSSNAKTGAHQAHLQMLNGLSAVGSMDERCQNCHGTLPTAVTHATGSSTPAFQGLANKNGAMPAGYSAGNCSNTYCHNPAGSGGTLNPANAGTGTAPSWTDAAYLAGGTLKTLNNCNTCHKVPGEAGFASSASHDNITIASDCSGCHGHNGDASGPVGHQHMDGILYGNGSCDNCHGYPPMSAAQLAARADGTYLNAKLEDYPGGGGFHASHLLASVSSSQGFTPCLPCHPSTSHMQGGSTVLQANVNVFDAADTSFRFNSGLPKTYDSVATTCSNVSCHFQPSPAWNN